MTSDAKKYELSNYRIKQAEESIEEAELTKTRIAVTPARELVIEEMKLPPRER